MSQDQERRQFSRVSFISTAELDVGGAAIPCTMLDISLHGVLLKLDADAELGEQHLLSFTLGGNTSPIAIQVHPVRREGDTVGCSFASIELDSLMHLRRLLEVNLDDPEQLQRELQALWPNSGGVADSH